MTALEELEEEVRKAADLRIHELIELVLNRDEGKTCIKHKTYLKKYTQLKIDLTHLKRRTRLCLTPDIDFDTQEECELYFANSKHSIPRLEAQIAVARERYHSEPCICNTSEKENLNERGNCDPFRKYDPLNGINAYRPIPHYGWTFSD